jgi:CRP-like cAMP-binding protein
MHEQLRTYILLKEKNEFPLPDAEFELMKQAFVPKKLRKKQYLLQEGEVCKYHAFVVKGCLRMFRVDDRGQEHIFQFAIENWWTGDRESLISGKPSKYNIEALEDSDLLLITPEAMENLQAKSRAVNAMVQHLQQNNVIATQNRIHAAISYTAEEKYLDFLKTYPDIFQRVPQQMIASYLGITRETLSRIRKQAVQSK